MYVLKLNRPASSFGKRTKPIPREVMEELLTDQGALPECLEPFLDHLERNQ